MVLFSAFAGISVGICRQQLEQADTGWSQSQKGCTAFGEPAVTAFDPSKPNIHQQQQKQKGYQVLLVLALQP